MCEFGYEGRVRDRGIGLRLSTTTSARCRRPLLPTPHGENGLSSSADFPKVADMGSGETRRHFARNSVGHWTQAISLVSLIGVVACRMSGADLPADHAVRMERGLERFKNEIRPLLIANCVECHGGESTKGAFDLATREGLLLGGADGAVIEPFQPASSRLLSLLRHAEEPHMPHKAPRLTDDEILMVSDWINDGAPYLAPLIEGKTPPKDRSIVTEQDREWWAFRPLSKPTLPAEPDGMSLPHPIDRFIIHDAARHGLPLEPAADRRTLVRRATLDLTGLPPTPEEVEAFVADDGVDAWERLLDRLLASPQYGERWGRHWLDVARFAESSGFEHDTDREGAYHYRDFVIRALNADLPFDVFTRWQIAGDELDPQNPLAMTATGFLGAGVFPTQITANEVERTRYDAMDDMLSTTASAFLGLTVGCARCHDHKFDPIPTADYYGMLSTFTTTVRSVIELDVDPDPWTSEKRSDPTDASEEPTEKVSKVLICGEGYPALRMNTQGADFFEQTYLLKRGNTDQKNGVVSQGFLRVLGQPSPSIDRWQSDPAEGSKGSGRRLALANWLTDLDHGAGSLVARVAVNRLWQHHFGQGIVVTPNDFGRTGATPTHPELLDWLAGELVRNGWRLKPIHKLMMTSQVYQQRTSPNPLKERVDPDNNTFTRRSTWRLEAEAVRDALLAVSGALDKTLYGRGTRDESSRRRSIYFTVKRSQLMSSMVAFDLPEPLLSQGTRPTTTVVPQALMLLNADYVREWAGLFAQRIKTETRSGSLSDQVKRAFLIALGRSPTPEETADSLAFLQSQSLEYTGLNAAEAQTAALVDFCQVMFGLNEFVYLN